MWDTHMPPPSGAWPGGDGMYVILKFGGWDLLAEDA
jgi:hypothetical protein